MHTSGILVFVNSCLSVWPLNIVLLFLNGHYKLSRCSIFSKEGLGILDAVLASGMALGLKMLVSAMDAFFFPSFVVLRYWYLFCDDSLAPI